MSVLKPLTFPEVSTSVYTPRMKRVVRVMKRRVAAARKVTSVGIYNCKLTAGTELYSAHAKGDAGDFMTLDAATRKAVAMAAVKDATKRTLRNRGRVTKTVFVIYDDKQWVKGKGWSHYSGVPHTNHVHVGCSFSTTVKPPCAR